MDRRQQETVIADLIRSLGASLKSRRLYPPTHPSVRTPVEKCFSELLRIFADRSELALVVTDGTLVFEGVPLFNMTSSLELFMQRLDAIGAPAVIFEKGLTTGDIENFIRFLHETTEQGLSAERIQEILKGMGVAHIRVKLKKDDEEDDAGAAREIYDGAVQAVVSVIDDVRSGRIPSGAESDRVVRDMGGMLRKNRDAILALTLIKNFDEYTYNHSVNVAVLSLALADSLSLAEAEKIEVGVAGLLHDVGKTQLALDLIRKPGGLTDAEFEEIKKHPEEGYVLLGKMSHIRPGSAYMVLEHHMRFDHKGYPKRDTDYKFHANSGLISVSDCYDALTTMRSYQKARSPLEALALMKKLGGNSLPADLVDALAKTMGPYPIGTTVRLNTMEVGIVTATGAAGPTKVTLLADKDGAPLPKPEIADLTEIISKGGIASRSVVGTANPLLYPAAGGAVAAPAAS